MLPPPPTLDIDLSVQLLTQLAALHVFSGKKELHAQPPLSQQLSYIATATDPGLTQALQVQTLRYVMLESD